MVEIYHRVIGRLFRQISERFVLIPGNREVNAHLWFVTGVTNAYGCAVIAGGRACVRECTTVYEGIEIICKLTKKSRDQG